jgi:hypothetical protein
MKPLSRQCAIITAVAITALLTGATRASAHGASLEIGGRFVCTVGGDQVPLVGAHPVLFRAHTYLIDYPQYVSAAEAPSATPYTGSDGTFRFGNIPAGDTYFVEVGLNDADGVSVRAWGDALPFRAQTPHYGIDGSGPVDLGTNQFPGPGCAVFEAMRQAEASYAQVMGSRPPYGDLHVDYGGPTEGFPWADGSSIEWPQGYAAGDETALNVAAAHAFALTIENFAFQGSSLLQEALHWDFRVRTDPCAITTPEVAFYEGFASFWAGDYAPAPDCGGVSENDSSVEGMVAWRLTKMEHLCTTASRKQMIATLLKSARSVHSVDDFAAALGPCNAGFLDPSRVQRYRWTGHVDVGRFVRDVQAQAREARLQADRIASKLDTARRAAAHVVCPPFPCGKAIAAKLAPSILTGAVKQERLLAATLDAQVSPSAQRQLTGPPTQAFLRSVLTTPTRLTKQLAAIGAASITTGLENGAPLEQRARAGRPASWWWNSQGGLVVGWWYTMKNYYRRLAAGDLRFGRAGPEVGVGGLLPVSGVTANRPDDRTRRVPWSGRIHFASGQGYVVTTINGVHFGGPKELAFPGDPGARVCEGSPVEIVGSSTQFWAALAPYCPATDRPGEYVTGTMIKFPSPVQSVSIGIGAKRFEQLGHYFPLAAVLTAYDARGRPVGLETTTVVGNPDGNPEKTLKVTVGKDVGIIYLGLDLNAHSAETPDEALLLTFNELAWIGG